MNSFCCRCLNLKRLNWALGEWGGWNSDIECIVLLFIVRIKLKVGDKGMQIFGEYFI
jgi:hypothetical protein